MKAALGEIESDAQTIGEYADKLIPLIYGQHKPLTDDFGNVTDHFGNVTERIGRQEWRCA